MNTLWDEIEAVRSDCCFVYITHDLDFAKSRSSKQKFALQNYKKDRWDILPVPEDENFPEEIITKIMGSRRPILFVEGEGTSIDINVYQKVYPDFLVVPRGSCEDVIHAVASFNANKSLHHVSCAGLIDKDARSEDDIKSLATRNIFTLPVAEVENLFLYEKMVCLVCASLKITGSDLDTRIQAVKDLVIREAGKNKESCSFAFAKKQIDKMAKKIGFTGGSIEDLVKSASENAISPQSIRTIFEEKRAEFDEAISAHDYTKIIEIYDKKGLGSQIGGILGLASKNYAGFILRSINSEDEGMLTFLRSVLPTLTSPVEDPAKEKAAA